MTPPTSTLTASRRASPGWYESSSIPVANQSFRKELGVLPAETLEALCEKLRLVMGV